MLILTASENANEGKQMRVTALKVEGGIGRRGKMRLGREGLSGC